MEIIISDDGFLNLIRNQNGGALVDELDRELIKANEAVLDHGGKAVITLSISVQRIKNLESAMDIGHDVKVTLPKAERPHSAMFLTTGNGLSADHQKQESLPLGAPVNGVSMSLVPADKVQPITGSK